MILLSVAEKLDLLAKRNRWLFALQPLHAGLLTDLRADRSKLPATDRFGDPANDGDYALLEALQKRLKSEIGQSLTSFAYRFVLSTPLVPCVITGLNSPRQVDEAVAAVEGPAVSPETLRAALEVWRAHRE
jgi:L-glyceraldehyde 3-phosphate reductase